MRLSKNLVPVLAITAAFLAMRSAHADDDPAEKAPVPQAAPARIPGTDADKTLPLSDPIPRPATPSLLPEEIPLRAKRPAKPAAPAVAKAKTQDTAADLDLRVRYRKARNVAETSERVRGAWEETRYPKNDQQKRDALRRYYDLLFAKMLSMDRGLAPLVEERRKAERAALTQTHIAPTVPGE